MSFVPSLYSRTLPWSIAVFLLRVIMLQLYRATGDCIFATTEINFIELDAVIPDQRLKVYHKVDEGKLPKGKSLKVRGLHPRYLLKYRDLRVDISSCLLNDFALLTRRYLTFNHRLAHRRLPSCWRCSTLTARKGDYPFQCTGLATSYRFCASRFVRLFWLYLVTIRVPAQATAMVL